MSIIFEQERQDEVRDLVHELWQLDSRPDLEDDCVEYAYSRYDTIPVYQSVIEFLSSHCGQAMSNQDLGENGDVQTIRKRYITISLRKRGWNRYMINTPEIISEVQRMVSDLLASYEFEVPLDPEVKFHYGHMTYAEQVELFSNTIIYISMWGAALTNMLFMPEDSVIIPIYFPSFPGNQYYRMAANMNIHYLPLRLTNVTDEEANRNATTVCWRPQEIKSHRPAYAQGQPHAYRERQQSSYLSRFAKGGWLHLRANCAYVIPIDKLEPLVNQAMTIALLNLYPN